MVRLRHPSPAMVVAAVALTVALGGASYAATVLPRNSVGTVQLKPNSVNSSKVLNGSLLRADFKAGQIPAGPAGPAGAAGPQGPAGPKGDKGDSAAALWASVDQNGTLVRNKGASSAQKNALGQYQVVFNQDVTGCVYEATLGGPTTGIYFGQVTATQLPAVANGVRVLTTNSAGALGDASFFLAVFC